MQDRLAFDAGTGESYEAVAQGDWLASLPPRSERRIIAVSHGISGRVLYSRQPRLATRRASRTSRRTPSTCCSTAASAASTASHWTEPSSPCSRRRTATRAHFFVCCSAASSAPSASWGPRGERHERPSDRHPGLPARGPGAARQAISKWSQLFEQQRNSPVVAGRQLPRTHHHPRRTTTYHAINDPEAIRRVLLDNVDNYPKPGLLRLPSADHGRGQCGRGYARVGAGEGWLMAPVFTPTAP